MADHPNGSVPFSAGLHSCTSARCGPQEKCPKTKGNVLDPIEVIGEYGTDATRFTFGGGWQRRETDIAFKLGPHTGFTGRLQTRFGNAGALLCS